MVLYDELIESYINELDQQYDISYIEKEDLFSYVDKALNYYFDEFEKVDIELLYRVVYCYNEGYETLEELEESIFQDMTGGDKDFFDSYDPD